MSHKPSAINHFPAPPRLWQTWAVVVTHSHSFRAGRVSFEQAKRDLVDWCREMRIDALGLVLDSDPRRVTKTGSAQTGDPATDTAADDPSAEADETDPAQADQQD